MLKIFQLAKIFQSLQMSVELLTDQEMEALLKPVSNEEDWRRKQRQVIRAANQKNEERDKIRKELYVEKKKYEDLEDKYTKLLSETDALKEQKQTTCEHSSSVERLQVETSLLVSELGLKDEEFFNGAQDLPTQPNVEQLDEFVKIKIDQNAKLRSEVQSLSGYLITMEKEREKHLNDIQSLKNQLNSVNNDLDAARGAPRTIWGTQSQIRTLNDFPALGGSKPRVTTPSAISTFTGDSSASSAETMCQLILSRFDNLEETLRIQGVVVKPKAIPSPKTWADKAEDDDTDPKPNPDEKLAQKS